MSGFCITNVYPATLEQFIRQEQEGWQWPLDFIWDHGDHEGHKVHKLFLKGDGTFKGKGYGDVKDTHLFSINSGVLSLGVARDANGKVNHTPGYHYNEFEFPISVEKRTKSCLGKGPKGYKQHLPRFISLDPTMEPRIAALNEHATAHYASILAAKGEGQDDEDRWFMAQRYIAESCIVSREKETQKVDKRKRKNKGTLKNLPYGLEVKHEVKLKTGTTHTWYGLVVDGQIRAGAGQGLKLFNTPSEFAKAHIRDTDCNNSILLNGWLVCKGWASGLCGRADQWVKLDEFRV